jgi:hypothetical protein
MGPERVLAGLMLGFGVRGRRYSIRQIRAQGARVIAREVDRTPLKIARDWRRA